MTDLIIALSIPTIVFIILIIGFLLEIKDNR